MSVLNNTKFGRQANEKFWECWALEIGSLFVQVNDWSPVRYQAITSTYADILSVEPKSNIFIEENVFHNVWATCVEPCRCQSVLFLYRIWPSDPLISRPPLGRAPDTRDYNVNIFIHHRKFRALIQYKDVVCQYRKSHCGDKTVVRSSYLHNGISYTGKW